MTAKPKPFTDGLLGKLKVGDKITDAGCQGLTARALKGGVTLEWRGRINGEKATVRLAIWCPYRELPDPATEEERLFRMAADASPGLLHVDLTKLPPFLTIDQARAVAATMTANVRQRRDPRAIRHDHKASTVSAALDRFEQEWVPTRRQGRETLAMLRRRMEPLPKSYPIGKRPLGEVRPAHLKEVLAPLETNGQAGLAKRVRTDMAIFFAWCRRQHLIEASPVAGVELENREGYAPRAHVPTLAECRAIFEGAEQCGDVKTRVLVRLLLLGGFRRNEVTGLEWGEIDEAGGRIVIPAARRKAVKRGGVDLVLPLTDAMRGELALLPRTSKRVFGALGGLARRKAAIQKASGTSGWSFHDFRRAVHSHLGDAGVQYEVRERILGHKFPGIAAYNQARLERQVREALALWEELVRRGEPFEDEGAEVLPIRRAG